MSKRAILTINAGSSSLKFALYQITGTDLRALLRGQVEGIGSKPHFVVRGRDGRLLYQRFWARVEPFESLLATLLEWIEDHLAPAKLVAVGHRVVYGLAHHDGPERVTPDLLQALDKLAPLAPLHVPHNLAPIRHIAESHPDILQIACFDTAFHCAMPDIATRFALPPEFAAAGVRRYGFHGLSYAYIARQLRCVAPDLAKGRVIVCHLGSGASLCAMRNGKSVDTTMGFTALDGLVMGTRTGNIDPGVVLYMMQGMGMSAKEIETTLYCRSGLLGLSGGLSSDMRDLLESDDLRAAAAVETFVYRAVREIGGLVSVLGGVDGIVFSAGIGENSAEIRTGICEGLSWLGVKLDERANRSWQDQISGPDSSVAVWVVPTDEEAMIARYGLDLLEPVEPAHA
jgi:acetate kinase